LGDYSEYIVDATFEKCDARAYLHGAAHQGFFYSLFPSFSRLGLRFSPHGVPTRSSTFPVFSKGADLQIMCASIRTKCEELKKKMNLSPNSQGKIPLYITGHSLGGALASLFYCRLRKGKDLDDVCDVRDTYVYGCPGVGDTDFAMGYASYSPFPLCLLLVFESAVMWVGIHVFHTTRCLLCGEL
jgi:hypothetical protein